MKKLCSLLALMLCALTAHAQTEATYQTLTPAVTALAATSTNSTAGTTLKLWEGARAGRIYLVASGVAGTTNGSLIVKFSTASGSYSTTNEFDTASLSTVKLTMSSLGAVTNTISDWFDLRGVNYLRVGQMENTFQGAVSNIVIRVGYLPYQ